MRGFYKDYSQLQRKRRHARDLHRRLKVAGRSMICEVCQCQHMTQWNGEWMWRDWPVKLQIDHINGRKLTEEDDRLDNLRYICPNCHTQTKGRMCTKTDKWRIRKMETEPLVFRPRKNLERKTKIATTVLHKRLQNSGRLYICEWCRCENMQLENGQWKWNENVITLEIDHIKARAKGGSDDTDNLRYLCSNCHSQTSNWGGKGKL